MADYVAMLYDGLAHAVLVIYIFQVYEVGTFVLFIRHSTRQKYHQIFGFVQSFWSNFT